MSNDPHNSSWNKIKLLVKSTQKNWQENTLPDWKRKSEKGLQALTQTASRPAIHRKFILACLILVVLYLSPLVTFFLQSKTSVPRGVTPINSIIDFPLDTSNRLGEFIQHMNQLKQSDPFKTNHQQAGDGGDIYQICEDATRSSSLPFALDSTIVMQDPNKSLAALQNRNSGNKIQAYRTSEKVGSQARIDRIERLRVVLRNFQNGQCEYIANSVFDPKKQVVKLMDAPSAQNFLNAQTQNDSIKNDGNVFQINKAFMKAKLADINSILTQAKAIPITNPDGTMSFRIEEVEPGSIYAQLNINNGDVINQINGQAITSMSDVMSMMSGLGNMSSLNLTLLRSGSEVTQQYNFVE